MIAINLIFFKKIANSGCILGEAAQKFKTKAWHEHEVDSMVEDKMRNSKSVHDTIRIYPDVAPLSALANLRFDTQWA